MQKSKQSLKAVKVISAMGLTQRILMILYNQSVNSILEYGLGLLTLSDTQYGILDRIRNEGMRTKTMLQQRH